MSFPLGWLSDVRFALRRLRASPLFTIFAVLTLALGIGATTAIYSVIRAALSPPPGVTTLDRLVTITHSAGGSLPTIALSYGDYQDLRARQTVFQDVAGWALLRVSYSAGQTGSGWGERVSGEYFQVLGVGAALGRTLQPADDDPSATPVAVISHGMWQRMFGGASDVVGRLMKVNGLTFEIVGVASRDFAGLFNSGLVPSAVWMPLGSSRTMPGARDNDVADRSSRWIQVRARLKDGVTFEAARADVTRIAQQLDQTTPLRQDGGGRRPSYASSRPWITRRTADTFISEGTDRVVQPLAATVLVAVGLVLLVACTNLANLVLARGSGRHQETAIRLALGASRGRLLRGELIESLLLAAAGGFVGLGVARVVLILLGNDLPVGNGTSIRFVPRLDLSVLAMSAGATVLAVLVAGLLPALQSTRTDVRAAMASGTSAALPRWRGRRMLIAAQVTVSVVLVAIAGLCLGRLREQSRIDLGVDLDRVALAEIDFNIQQYPESRAREISDTLLATLMRRPGVTAASVSSGLPIGIGTPGAYLGDTSRLTHRAELVSGTPGIFDTLGVRILKGRALNDRDTPGSVPVAVVSAFTADAVFGTTDVVGRSLFLQRTRWVGEPEHPVLSRTIVGIATDATADRDFPGRGGVVYLPLSQHYEGRLVIGARTDDDPATLVPVIRQALAAADPNVAIAQAGTGMAIAGPSNLFLQITAGLTGILGGFALTLALAGLYGALSHVILRRRREIGLRMALGASRPDILRMVLRDGLRPVVSGIMLGLILGAVARLWMTPLFDRLLPPLDPFVLTVVPLLLLACGAVACLVPARRASNVDPNLALRDL